MTLNIYWRKYITNLMMIPNCFVITTFRTVNLLEAMATTTIIF